MKSHSGNESDSKVFKDRMRELQDHFNMDTDRIWIADSKLYSKDIIEGHKQIRFLTRVPASLKLCKDMIEDSVSLSQWKQTQCDKTFYRELEQEHYGHKQKWVVCYSTEGLNRSSKTLLRQAQKQRVELEKKIFHLQAERYSCEKDAEAKAEELIKKSGKYQKLTLEEIKKVPCYESSGRPKAGVEADHYKYQVILKCENVPLEIQAHEKACFVLATSVLELEAEEVIKTYKQQGQVELGFRFMKDPYFFTSSLYLKSPKRIAALLMIMTLSLMVYTVAQRRLRRALEKHGDTIMNQVGKPTRTPTMKWVFQMFFGVNLIEIRFKKVKNTVIQGLSEVHFKILKYISAGALRAYTLQDPIA